MESSDDEAETAHASVSDYHFEDEDDQPVSFAVLPLRLDGNGAPASASSPSSGRHITLFGKVDNGLQKVSKQVAAWRYDLSSSASGPVVSVLTKEGAWISLEGKPVKWYGEREARTVLVALACLHFVKWNPEASPKTLWDHLAKVFSWFGVKPNQNDLLDSMALVSEAVKSDASLSKSKFLLAVLEEKPEKTVRHRENLQSKTISEFIVDDEGDYDYEVDLEEDEAIEEDLFDSVCAFCDNGGELLCCDGVCMRSFHPFVEASSQCEGLGLTQDKVEAIKNYMCKNCKYKQHQCYVCGKLGVSDKSCSAEVFRCFNATCGHFYHPHCIAKLLHPNDEAAEEELQKNIAKGESFTCTIHKCAVCQGGEKKKEKELQFAVCRRCPTSYHRKCLPREIPFEKYNSEGGGQEDDEVGGEEEGVTCRAWEGLLPNRILIYCLKHEILEEFGTPERDHIVFPAIEEKKKQEVIGLPARTKPLQDKRKLASDDSFQKKKLLRESEKFSSASKRMKSLKKEECVSDSEGKVGADEVYRLSLNEKKKSVLKTDTSVTLETKKSSLGSKLYNYMAEKEGNIKQEIVKVEPNKLAAAKISTVKLESKAPLLDADSKRRILTLMKESGSSVSLEDVRKKYQVPITHQYSSKNVIDKNITLGKVEGAVEAVRTAVKKLKNHCSIDDAKAVCEPEVLNQILLWQSKLKVYLAPFLHGTRYTSFGRHFTKVEKLEEIVNMLHWYVENGDMIVDFCCGANDFSWILKKKLEQTGKKCLFKNFDVFQPKNDFNFEKRDWMSVKVHELKEEGRPLIMGLNPPFGVKAALANKFINKALEFKPKLLILIVPQETKRLDKKDPPYDLVWEDSKFCSGKSFYLPGSIDVYDKQMEQWNLTPPVLYLWSHPDWTAKHRAIAEKKGHLSSGHRASNAEDRYGRETRDHSVQDSYNEGDASVVVDDPVITVSKPNLSEQVTNDVHGWGKSHCEEMSHKRRNDGHGKPPASKYIGVVSNHVPSEVPIGQSAVMGTPSRSLDSSYGLEPFGTVPSGLDVQHEVPYGGHPSNVHGVGGSHNLSNSRPHTPEFFSSDDVFGSYLTDLEREKLFQPQVDHYQHHSGSLVQSNYFSGHDVGFNRMGFGPSPPYESVGSAQVPSYRMRMSATQRYAPQLNELDMSRFDGFGPESPRAVGGQFFDTRPSHLQYPVDPMNFDPGPHRPYSHDSAGWLND